MKYRMPPNESDDSTTGGVNPQYLGRGVRDRLAGALCYRLGGQTDRARTTCKQGIAIVDDVRDYDDYPLGTEDTDPQVGLLYEMLGDFRLYGGLDGWLDDYDTAEEYYRDSRSPSGWQGEVEFVALMHLPLELADAVDYDLDEDVKFRASTLSLMDRIAFKRTHYEEIHRRVLEKGSWTG